MITFLVGKRNKAFDAALAKLLGSAEGVERASASPDSIGILVDRIRTPALFGGKKTFVISGLTESDAAFEFFAEQGEGLSAAPHDAIVLAESLLAADTKKAEAFASVVRILEKEAKPRAFDPFILGNALASGDRKQGWLAFSQVAHNGDEMEPTHGLIWWKLKDLMQKGSKYSPDQLRAMARDLVSAYHESRLGGVGMRERLEVFFLNMPAPDSKK